MSPLNSWFQKIACFEGANLCRYKFINERKRNLLTLSYSFINFVYIPYQFIYFYFFFRYLACVFNNTCMPINATWLDGCRNRKCVVRKTGSMIQRDTAPISAGK